MVTVINYVKRTNTEGKEFNALVLQGDLEMILSKQSGRYYATAKTCSITCTFNDSICQDLIGKQIPGSIEKVKTEPYDYQIPNSDEVVTLDFSYYYRPAPGPIEHEIPEKVAKAA
jgi:hypothetical protein